MRTTFVAAIFFAACGTASTTSSGGSIERIAFINNTASGTDPAGGGAVNALSDIATFAHDTFVGNSAAGGVGGAIADTGDNSYDDIIFMNNTAKDGGAFYLQQENSTTLTNISMVGNTSTDSGAAYVTGELAFTFDFLSATNNISPGAEFADSRNGFLEMNESAVWGSHDFSGGGESNSSCLSDVTGFDSFVITLDGSTAALGNPFFTAASGQLFLLPGGACVDSASGGGTAWLGLTTQQTLAPDAAPVDRGAHWDPESPIIWTIGALGSVLTWTDGNVASCRLFDSNDTNIATVTSPYTYSEPSGTTLTLVCTGAGMPAVAQIVAP